MSAIATPTRQAILNLYHTSLRTSQSFSSYNFREYFVRRTKDSFRTIQVRWWTPPVTSRTDHKAEGDGP